MAGRLHPSPARCWNWPVPIIRPSTGAPRLCDCRSCRPPRPEPSTFWSTARASSCAGRASGWSKKHGTQRRRAWKKLHVGMDAAVAEHTPDAAVIVPPRSTAVPSATAETNPTQRDQHLQSIAEHGRMAWQKFPHRRSADHRDHHRGPDPEPHARPRTSGLRPRRLIRTPEKGFLRLNPPRCNKVGARLAATRRHPPPSRRSALALRSRVRPASPSLRSDVWNSDRCAANWLTVPFASTSRIFQRPPSGRST